MMTVTSLYNIHTPQVCDHANRHVHEWCSTGQH